MYGNGAGTGLQTVTMQKQKEEVTQLVLRLGLIASTAVVVGAAVRTAVLFLAVAASTRTSATTTLAFVLCVPVLIKFLKALRAKNQNCVIAKSR